MAAVLSRPYGSIGGVVACLVGGGVLLGVLALLQREPVRPDDAEATPAVSRRRMIRLVAAVAIATAVAGTAGELLASRRRRRRDLDQLRDSLELSVNRGSHPAGRRPRRPGSGAVADVQPCASIASTPRSRRHSSTPREWRLRIHGMVDREMTVSYQDLLDRGLRNEWITLCCVSNPVGGDLISNTVFSGVPMTHLLDEVGVQSGADMLLSTSEDGWTCGTPLAAITDGRNAMLALGMDGVPLPVEHGFPVRQVVPGLYGYVSATKWVIDWEVTRFDDAEAYWTKRGWSALGPVKTQSRIDVPRGTRRWPASSRSPASPGPSTPASRRSRCASTTARGSRPSSASVPSDDTWVQWRWEWDARPGRHRLEVRATDTSGYTQTSKRADVVPDGATGYHGVDISVA